PLAARMTSGTRRAEKRRRENSNIEVTSTHGDASTATCEPVGPRAGWQMFARPARGRQARDWSPRGPRRPSRPTHLPGRNRTIRPPTGEQTPFGGPGPPPSPRPAARQDPPLWCPGLGRNEKTRGPRAFPRLERHVDLRLFVALVTDDESVSPRLERHVDRSRPQ